MKGFFAASDTVSKPPVSHIPQCGKCGLYKLCKSPKMKVDGKGEKGILIVGEAPGATEDDMGIPFCGDAGEKLMNDLSFADINLRRDCWITNTIICRPEDNKYPPAALEYCRPNLVNAVKELNPRVIVLLGGYAAKSLLGWVWKEDVGPMGRWAGWQIPNQKLNTWILPTWHPSYLIRDKKDVRDMLFRKHLARAAKHDKRPWKTIPIYHVERIYDSAKAGKLIRSFEGDQPVAIDYETNMLKPYSKESRIISCSLSDGETTIAYPWEGDAIAETGRLLESGTPMEASNLQFEESWTQETFGHGVLNWAGDTTLNAHILSWDGVGDSDRGSEREKDDAPGSGITSIKFQAFVLLGIDAWDVEIKPFLRTGGGPYKKNKIADISMPKLLWYNGLDALIERKVSEVQHRLKGA